MLLKLGAIGLLSYSTYRLVYMEKRNIRKKFYLLIHELNLRNKGEQVYYLHRIPSTHRLLLADFYSELIYNDAMILEFITEYKTGCLRSDGFVRYIYSGYEVIQFVEVVLTHKVNFDKYEKLKESGEIQNKYDIFPAVVVIDHNPINFKSSTLKILTIDHNMKNFKNIVLP